jgi:hypothetical protein
MDFTKKGRERLLSNFAEHFLELSNGTIMRVSVCSNCKLLLVAGTQVQKTADNILSKHKDYWQTDENAPQGFADFTVVDPNASEDKILAKRGEDERVENEKLDLQKSNFIENNERIMAQQEAEIEKTLQEQKEFDDLNFNL